jgi:hypothetical protein
VESYRGPNPARAGFWYQGEVGSPIEIRPGKPYWLSFYYRTEGLADRKFALWFSKVFWEKYEHRFPSTDGEWRKVVGVMWSLRSDAVNVEPFWRLWGAGRVWVDQFEIRLIETDQCGQFIQGETNLFVR